MEFSKTFDGGRVFKVSVSDVLGRSVDATVNPANSSLSHGGRLAAIISAESGPAVQPGNQELERIPVTQNVVTTAGHMLNKGTPYCCLNY